VALFARPWGIDFSDIVAPARLWIGTADTAVPLVAARALARRIRGCSCEELTGEGHFWVAANHARVLDWIATTVRTDISMEA
jgi:surfactin synthase thioesterase subunit